MSLVRLFCLCQWFRMRSEEMLSHLGDVVAANSPF